jgi:hypothetical protein
MAKEVVLIVSTDMNWALPVAEQLASHELKVSLAVDQDIARSVFNSMLPHVIVMSPRIRHSTHQGVLEMVKDFRAARPTAQLIGVSPHEHEREKMVEAGVTHLCCENEVFRKIFTVLGKPSPER